MAKYPDVTAGQTEACINRMGGMNNFIRFIGGEGKLVFEEVIRAVVSLLEFISTINISATTGRFVTRDKFKLKKNSGICSYLGDNFTNWFLGKIEEPIGEQTLRYAKLRKSSLDSPIISELGGEEKAETTLAEVFSLMDKQFSGEEGVLLTNGWANIFYVKDRSGVLRSVIVYWYDGGWGADAYEVSYPYGWHAGNQVFSRNYPSVPQELAVS